MNTLKTYGILLLKFIGLFLFGSLILSVLNYFLFTSKVTHIIGFIYLIIISIILSFQSSKKSESRGIVTGLKNGFLFIFLLSIFNLIFYQSSFKFLRIVYYLILLISCIFGAVIGVNTKKE